MLAAVSWRWARASERFMGTRRLQSQLGLLLLFALAAGLWPVWARGEPSLLAAVEERLPASQDDMKALRNELRRIDRRLGEIERRLDELPHDNGQN